MTYVQHPANICLRRTCSKQALYAMKPLNGSGARSNIHCNNLLCLMILNITFYYTTEKKYLGKKKHFKTIYFLCEMVINKSI